MKLRVESFYILVANVKYCKNVLLNIRAKLNIELYVKDTRTRIITRLNKIESYFLI